MKIDEHEKITSHTQQFLQPARLLPVVLTSIKISNFTHATIIDDTTGLAAILLVVSCIFSFLAIRSKNDRRALKLEAVADIAFLVALVSIAVTIILVSFNFFG